MSSHVSVIEVPRYLPENKEEEASLELRTEEDSARLLWSCVFFLAVRDGASAVHYRPWQADSLSYVVSEVEYFMVPPPEELAACLLAVAREWAAGPGAWGVVRRWASRALRQALSGQLVIEHADGKSEWAVVCWSVGRYEGVDLYRLDGSPATASVQEPATA